MHTKVTSATQEVIIGQDQGIVIIGERINPTGRKKLASSLEKHDMSFVQQEAQRQVDSGAHLIDVNVGISGGDEKALMLKALEAVGQVTDVPLCIDSANPKVLTAALEAYPGKALVNSVNGEEAKLKEVLPVVADYKAAVIALTMDDKGIPSDVSSRLRITENILNHASKLGIPEEDIVIDALAMSVASDDQAGKNVLESIYMIKERFGLNQTIGASNVSFGLPDRRSVNTVFLAMAVVCGLTCPITDPTVWDTRRTLLIADLLNGHDEFVMNYITAYREQFPEE